MDQQARLPPALAAIHNFIRKHDPHDLHDYENAEDPQPGLRAVEEVAEGELSVGLPGAAERRQTDTRRNGIAQDMWEQYRAECSRCNQGR